MGASLVWDWVLPKGPPDPVEQHCLTLLALRAESMTAAFEYPVRDLARAMRVSERTARRLLASLRDQGYLVVVLAGGKGAPTVWALGKSPVVDNVMHMGQMDDPRSNHARPYIVTSSSNEERITTTVPTRRTVGTAHNPQNAGAQARIVPQRRQRDCPECHGDNWVISLDDVARPCSKCMPHLSL